MGLERGGGGQEGGLCGVDRKASVTENSRRWMEAGFRLFELPSAGVFGGFWERGWGRSCGC